MSTWPHAPSRRVTDPGTIIITASTYRKQHFFHDAVRLKILHDALLELADEDGWDLLAWAVLTNHYHIVGVSPDKENPSELSPQKSTPGRVPNSIGSMTALAGEISGTDLGIVTSHLNGLSWRESHTSRIIP
jgi:hypothetical protein